MGQAVHVSFGKRRLRRSASVVTRFHRNLIYGRARTPHAHLGQLLMTTQWKLKALFCGKISVPKNVTTPGLDSDLVFDVPYLAFLLLGVRRKILVDTGISEKYITNGKAWGGLPAEGGGQYLLTSLAEAGIEPGDIDTVIFTHLHNDHAGNNTLFENAHFVFQKDEWKTLLDPLPIMKLRRDYDPAIISDLKNLDYVLIDGDMELSYGVRLIKTPGHTPGSQSICIQTEKGFRILVGDHWHHYYNGFSQLTRFVDLNDKTYDITPAPEVYGPFIPPGIVYNYYDWYASSHKIRALIGPGGLDCVLPGHEPLLLKKYGKTAQSDHFERIAFPNPRSSRGPKL